MRSRGSTSPAPPLSLSQHVGRGYARLARRLWFVCASVAALRLRLTCAAVGNIPYDMSEEQLIAVFAEVGKVVGFR